MELARPDTLVELGSGTAEKTRVLLDELVRRTDHPRYVPFDVSPEFLRTSALELVEEYPTLEVEGIVGDFDLHLGRLPIGGRRLVAFLGGTVGNFTPAERARMLGELTAGFGPGDHLLLGTDLVKDPARLVAAYDDSAGVTAEFNRNVLRVLARQLDADVDPDGFEHVAVWNDVDEWIEMRLRARGEQVIRIPELDLEVRFADGEELRTEISAKFRLDGLRDELDALGLRLVQVWTDHRRRLRALVVHTSLIRPRRGNADGRGRVSSPWGGVAPDLDHPAAAGGQAHRAPRPGGSGPP